MQSRYPKAYTVKTNSANWHLEGCQTLVRKMIRLGVPNWHLVAGCQNGIHEGAITGAVTALMEVPYGITTGAKMAPVTPGRRCHDGTITGAVMALLEVPHGITTGAEMALVTPGRRCHIGTIVGATIGTGGRCLIWIGAYIIGSLHKVSWCQSPKLCH